MASGVSVFLPFPGNIAPVIQFERLMERGIGSWLLEGNRKGANFPFPYRVHSAYNTACPLLIDSFLRCHVSHTQYLHFVAALAEKQVINYMANPDFRFSQIWVNG